MCIHVTLCALLSLHTSELSHVTCTPHCVYPQYYGHLTHCTSFTSHLRADQTHTPHTSHPVHRSHTACPGATPLLRVCLHSLLYHKCKRHTARVRKPLRLLPSPEIHRENVHSVQRERSLWSQGASLRVFSFTARNIFTRLPFTRKKTLWQMKIEKNNQLCTLSQSSNVLSLCIT